MAILDAISQAVARLLAGDGYLWNVILTSLATSLTALLLITPPCLLFAYALARRAFWGRRAIVIILQGLLAFPTVVVGLVLYLLFSRQGALGAWDLLFTQTAIIIGQMLIALPVLTVLTYSALQKNDALVADTARSLGARGAAVLATECFEARHAIAAAVLTGFGRVISEVGCALLVGGNIAYQTRTITTAITLDTGRGDFVEGIALGLVLILLTIGASVVLALLQKEPPPAAG